MIPDLDRSYETRLARACRRRRLPRRAETAGPVDWREYVACRVCPSGAGRACVDLILDGRHLAAVRLLDRPHLKRERRTDRSIAALSPAR